MIDYFEWQNQLSPVWNSEWCSLADHFHSHSHHHFQCWRACVANLAVRRILPVKAWMKMNIPAFVSVSVMMTLNLSLIVFDDDNVM